MENVLAILAFQIKIFLVTVVSEKFENDLHLCLYIRLYIRLLIYAL